MIHPCSIKVVDSLYLNKEMSQNHTEKNAGYEIYYLSTCMNSWGRVVTYNYNKMFEPVEYLQPQTTTLTCFKQNLNYWPSDLYLVMLQRFQNLKLHRTLMLNYCANQLIVFIVCPNMLIA